MITAKEAQDLMPKYDILNDGYPELNNLIKNAAKRGENSIEYTIIDSSRHVRSLRKALLELGYTTYIEDMRYSSPFDDRVRYVLTIEW